MGIFMIGFGVLTLVLVVVAVIIAFKYKSDENDVTMGEVEMTPDTLPGPGVLDVSGDVGVALPKTPEQLYAEALAAKGYSAPDQWQRCPPNTSREEECGLAGKPECHFVCKRPAGTLQASQLTNGAILPNSDYTCPDGYFMWKAGAERYGDMSMVCYPKDTSMSAAEKQQRGLTDIGWTSEEAGFSCKPGFVPGFDAVPWETFDRQKYCYPWSDELIALKATNKDASKICKSGYEPLVTGNPMFDGLYCAPTQATKTSMDAAVITREQKKTNDITKATGEWGFVPKGTDGKCSPGYWPLDQQGMMSTAALRPWLEEDGIDITSINNSMCYPYPIDAKGKDVIKAMAQADGVKLNDIYSQSFANKADPVTNQQLPQDKMCNSPWYAYGMFKSNPIKKLLKAYCVMPG